MPQLQLCPLNFSISFARDHVVWCAHRKCLTVLGGARLHILEVSQGIVSYKKSKNCSQSFKLDNPNPNHSSENNPKLVQYSGTFLICYPVIELFAITKSHEFDQKWFYRHHWLFSYCYSSDRGYWRQLKSVSW